MRFSRGLAVAVVLFLVQVVALSSFVPSVFADVTRQTVGTSTSANGWATNYPWQRKTWLMAGRYWVFYCDGSNVGWKSTADRGATWSAFTAITAINYGHRLGTWFDGTYIHFAFCTSADGVDVLYRRATPNSDGSLTYSAVWQTVVDVPAGKNVMYPTVVVDSASYPWVGYMLYDGGFNTAPYDAIVVKSSKNDGTWATAAGFPYVLVNDNTNQYPVPIGAPLTAGKMFWGYNKNVVDDVLYGREWNGAAWVAEEQMTVTHEGSYTLFNLISEGDNVHLAVWNKYRKRVYGVGWQTEEVYQVGGPWGTPTIGRSGSTIIVVWFDGSSPHHVNYRKKVGGTTWENIVDWITESDGVPQEILLNVPPNQGLFLAYASGVASPYTVRFSLADPMNDGLTLDLTGASVKGTKTLLAMKQDYKLIAKASSSSGVSYLDYSELRLDPAGRNVRLRWTEAGDAYTRFLSHFDGPDASMTVVDQCSHSLTCNGNAQIDTAESRFGGASGLFDGVGDYITALNSADFDFGTADWTVDFVLRRNGAQGSWAGVISAATSGNIGWVIYMNNDKVVINSKASGVWAQDLYGTIGLTDLTFVHAALVRNSNTLTIYINGQACGNKDVTGYNYDSAGTGLAIGRFYINTNDYYYKGHVEEVRITKGVARWTSNFTPPAAAYGPLFAESSDPSNYVTLNTVTCSYSTLGDQVTLNFYFMVNWGWGDSAETVTVQLYTVDDSGASDTDDYSNVFGVEAHLAGASLSVSKYLVNPSQALSFSGFWFYDGTSIAPLDGDFQVKVKLSGVQKGSTDTTLVGGAFSISGVAAEASIGSYSYTVEATYMQGAGSFASVAVSRLDLGSVVGLASSGSYQTKLNVTSALWAHNGSAVNGGLFTVYDGATLVGSATSGPTGLIQFTLTDTLHGTGTLVVSGTKSDISSVVLNVSYSVAVSGSVYVGVPSDWYAGENKTFTVRFTNAAQLNVTKIKLENVRLCFRLMNGATVLCQVNSTSFDVDPGVLINQTVTLRLTGASQEGIYVLRCLILQLGSEYALGTLDASVHVIVSGSVVPVVGGSFGDFKLTIPLIPSIQVLQGEVRILNVTFGVTGVSSAKLFVLNASGVPSGWIKVSAPSNIYIGTPVTVQVTMLVPQDADPTEYVVTIPLRASTDIGSVNQVLQFSLIVLQPEQPKAQFNALAWLQSLLREVSFPALLVIVLLVCAIVAAALVVLHQPKVKHGKYYHR